jgi:hypothetical protein
MGESMKENRETRKEGNNAHYFIAVAGGNRYPVPEGWCHETDVDDGDAPVPGLL